MSIFKVADDVTQIMTEKRGISIWDNTRWEAIRDFGADEMGDWGERVVLRICQEIEDLEVLWGDTNILPDGHYDFRINDSLRLEQKTARLNSDGKTFQHESLRLDGTCDAFLFLDVCPGEIYLTVIPARGIIHGQKHPILGRTPHKRHGAKDNEGMYKLDWTKRICEDRGIKGGITLKMTNETTSHDVKNFFDKTGILEAHWS